MTGWRIGWAIAPRAVTKAMGALQSHTTSNATTVSQHAALAALTDRAAAENAVSTMVREFQARRDLLVAAMAREPRLGFVHPEGAFYLYINVAAVQPDGDAGSAFATHLLERHDVAVVPGAAFLTPEWIRLSYAAPRESVMDGVARVITAFGELVP
jgi:aspartate aminotransferase